MSTPSEHERSIEIGAPIATVFDFHVDPRRAADIAPPGARVLEVEAPVPLAQGARVRMRIRPSRLGLPQEWLVRVETLEPPTLLVDVAERSPFAEWRHEHRMTPLGPDSTLLTDRVVYRARWGVVGRIASRLVLSHLIARTFRIRQERTKAILEARPQDP